MPPHSALHFRECWYAESYQFPSCAIANKSDRTVPRVWVTVALRNGCWSAYLELGFSITVSGC